MDSGRELDFERLSRIIGSNIQKISQNANSIQRMVNSLGTNQDTEDLRQRLHLVQQQTHQLAVDTNKFIKDIRNVPNTDNISDQRQRKLQKERLTDEFSYALNRFQEIQRVAASKEKESVKKARLDSMSSIGHEDEKKTGKLIDLDRQNKHRENYDPADAQMQIQEEANLNQLRERERAVQQIEADIVDVNIIFKDLASMVHEQGETIDSIEANVESTHVQVMEGAEQLTQARNYRSRARKKTCILIIIAAVILTVVILVVVFETR